MTEMTEKRLEEIKELLELMGVTLEKEIVAPKEFYPTYLVEMGYYY